jgi:alpha-D-ribose 1-methylphosphonate 5-triphosphate synthase subunit PhnI
MGMLDRGLRDGVDAAPAVSAEFVVYHTEGAEAWGGLNSLQLPAHVDFASELSLLREARNRGRMGSARSQRSRRLTLSDPPA